MLLLQEKCPYVTEHIPRERLCDAVAVVRLWSQQPRPYIVSCRELRAHFHSHGLQPSTRSGQAVGACPWTASICGEL